MDPAVLFHEIGKDPFYHIWHTTDQNMFLLVHTGSGSIVCHERSYPLEAGVLCFIGGKKLHYTLPDTPNRYDRSKLFFPMDRLENLMYLLPEHQQLQNAFTAASVVCARLTPDLCAEAEALMKAPQRYRTDDPYFFPTLLSSFLQLMILCDANACQSLSPASDDGIVRAIEYINRNIQHDLTLEEICAAVPMSKFHFSRSFRQAMGLPVMKYLQKTRIALAKAMLPDRSRTISQICAQCGFSSSSYFSRIFRDETGMTPSQYRASNTDIIQHSG